jgi:PAS domain S-box-containing protein
MEVFPQSTVAEPDSPGTPPGPRRRRPRVPGGPQASARSRRIFADLPATVWTTDDHLRVTFIQGVLLRRLGLTTDRLLGRTLPELLLDGREDHPLIQAHFTALAGHETTVRIEWGGDIYSARLAPRRAADGRIVGCIGVQLQIGWLPEDDLTVREGEIRLQRVVDWNVAGIAFGDDQGRITDANEAFFALTGYGREDLMPDGLSWPSLTAVEFHHRQIEAVQEILSSGRCRPFETELIRRDGRRVAVLVSAARLSARRREGVAFVLDISRYKATERRLAAELAVADALFSTPDLDVALVAVAQALAKHLPWESVAIWTSDPHGPRLRARHGESRLPVEVAAQLVVRALASGDDVTWSGLTGSGVVSLGRAGALFVEDVATFGVLSDLGPDPDRLVTTRAVVSRVRRWIEERLEGLKA